MKLREVERENYIRQQSRIERDRQIDSIVAKVDAEALKNQQEHEMKMRWVSTLVLLFFSFSNNLIPSIFQFIDSFLFFFFGAKYQSRLKEKYEREIKEVERQEAEAKEKHIESKTRLADCEANTANLKATVKQLETQLNHFKKVATINFFRFSFRVLWSMLLQCIIKILRDFATSLY